MEKHVFASSAVLLTVPPGDPRFCGVQKLRDSSPQPLFLHGRSPQQPARPPRRSQDGGHPEGVWRASGESAVVIMGTGKSFLVNYKEIKLLSKCYDLCFGGTCTQHNELFL